METKYGRRIKAARKHREITQEELAIKVGIKQSALSYIETGRNNTDDETALKIAQILNVSLEWIKGESNESDIPLEDYPITVKYKDTDSFSERFLEVFATLKAKGKFKNDADFADKNNISRASLSLALSGKTKINLEWVSGLQKYGANTEYIYYGKGSIILNDSLNEDEMIRIIGNMRNELDALEEYILKKKV
ncbi:MAG: XRE family transcriptional regulator [Flavobacterium sp.]|nr:MAG: XRE family transcriptional regulator [Flavobacterium sp.]